MKIRSLSIVSGLFLFASQFVLQTEARELTYKFGVGYRQATTNARVDDSKAATATQLNGLEGIYGISNDLYAGAFFGFEPNFNFVMVGPKLRYDIHRLINRELEIWSSLNIFVEAAFLAKFGRETKGGLTIHAPYLGFEIFPFTANNFSISTSAGLVLDFVQKNRIGFTNGMFGDVGVKYFF